MTELLRALTVESTEELKRIARTGPILHAAIARSILASRATS